MTSGWKIACSVLTLAVAFAGVASLRNAATDAPGTQPVAVRTPTSPRIKPSPSADDALLGPLDLTNAALDAQLRGCDMLDIAHCLLPFPNDHFTATVPSNWPPQGGTGRRLNFNVLAMPTNLALKPIDPTELNRNDGFSPGSALIAYVPGLAANADGTVPGAPRIDDLSQYVSPNISVVVIDTVTGQRHPVWAEIDLNAGRLLPGMNVPSGQPAQPALIVRPAVNFEEGRRYVVALRNLKNAGGATIPAGPAFALCRDHALTLLLPLIQRCAELEADVFPVLQQAGLARNASLYIAWDFTVASARNTTGRLAHMRDDAFRNVLGDVEAPDGSLIQYGQAPSYTLTEINDAPDAQTARRIKGVYYVPSYLTYADPTPLDGLLPVRQLLGQLSQQSPQAITDLLAQCAQIDSTGLLCNLLNPYYAGDLAGSLSLPLARLRYTGDGAVLGDPSALAFGDGLPDRNGQASVTFTCNIPRSALSGKTFDQALAADVRPSRATLYGHGLLSSQNEIAIEGARTFANNYGFMYCATEFTGLSTGNLPSAIVGMLDVSYFGTVPDNAQQGLLQHMFLARLMGHPNGFSADPAFQLQGIPVFDRSEVFYDGNSNGGNLGATVVAMSKDIRRAALGVPGMNLSTVIPRSTASVAFSPVFLAYQGDLERLIVLDLMQMLWDRSEADGYVQHITRNPLDGTANQVLMQAGFADHTVPNATTWVMARTVGVTLADAYPRKPGECGGDVIYCFPDNNTFLALRNPEVVPLRGLPLVGRDAGAVYDSAPCAGTGCRTAKSALMVFDEGKTTPSPLGNVPTSSTASDPHLYPFGTAHGQCQKAHFLHAGGRVIDVRGIRNVTGPETCPPRPD